MNILKMILNLFWHNPKLLLEIFIIVCISVLFKKIYPKFRGFMGEFWAKTELNKLPRDKYFILNDIMLEDLNGTHQIDHIVLSNYGFFVVEMKNYYGLIRGNEYDNKWCQFLGKNKSFFKNPIHQNYGHIKCLANKLKIDEKHFVSIICFSNQAKLNVNCKTIVTQLDYLKQEILKINILNNDFNINEVSDIIKSNNILDKKKRKKHVDSIHKKINHNQELENEMICPKCGSKLVEKKGKYGEFVGCSNYPKCRYIKGK